MGQDFWREFAICLGQIIWQTLFLKAYLKDKFWNYMGNMMTVSMIGTLLFIPAIFLNLNPVSLIIYFAFVICLIFLEHWRRCKVLKLNFCTYNKLAHF